MQLFLIGGYDLEMITIKKILIALGYENITETKDFSKVKCFADKKLYWGAKLSNYIDFFNYKGDI